MSLQPKTAIVICGPHQSGSAVLSGIFSKLNYSLGKNVLGIGGEDQNLVYENAKVQEFFNHFIQGTEYQWLSPFVSGSKLLSETGLIRKVKEFEKLISSEFEGQQDIVLKDPRFSVCLPLCLEGLHNLGYQIKVVVMLRHPHEVAMSMQNKHKLSLSRSNLIYTNYLSQSEYYTRNFDRAFVNFNSLIDKPVEVFKNLLSSLSLNDRSAENIKEGISIISKDKIKHRSAGDENPSYTTSKLYELFSEFKNSEKYKNANLEQQIDKLINEFSEWQLLVSESTQKAIGKSPYYSQLFFDAGEGFSEKDSLRNVIQGREKRFEYNLSTEKVNKLRFDPINTHCVMTIQSIAIAFESGEELELDFKGNFEKKGDYYVFDTDDPNITIDIPEVKQKIVKLDVKSAFVGLGKESINAFANSTPAQAEGASFSTKGGDITSILQQLSQQQQASLHQVKLANNELISAKEAELQKLQEDLKSLNSQLSSEKELLMKIQQDKIAIEKKLLEREKDIEKFEGDIEFYKSDIASNKMWVSQKNTEFANAQQSLNQTIKQVNIERARWKQVKTELDGKQFLIDNIHKSISYKLGFGMTAPARFVANIFKPKDGKPKITEYSDEFFTNPFVFDWVFYKMSNIDIEDECTSEEEYTKHWLETGIEELRTASPIFSLRYYMNRYDDIKQMSKPRVILAHFIKNGLKEGRQGSHAFKSNQYLEYNLDLSYGLGDNPEDIANHFLKYGIKEGRQGSRKFNVKDYLYLNRDLNKKFNGDYIEALVHYLREGHAEGRKTSIYELPSTTPKKATNNFQKYIGNNDLQVHKKFQIKPKISIIVPVYNVDIEYLDYCVNSILAQTYPNWEMLLIDDKSTKPHVEPALKQAAEQDERIKIFFRQENGNISNATNDGLEIATGEYTVFMDNDDALHKDAFYKIVEKINEHPEVELLYSDEDKIDEEHKRTGPIFKNPWSPITLGSFNYFNHLLCLKSSFIKEHKLRFDPEFDGCQDLAFIYSALPHLNHVQHIPEILYHWRAIEGSIARDGAAKETSFSFLDKCEQAIFGYLNKKADVKRVYQSEAALERNLALFTADYDQSLDDTGLVIINTQGSGIFENEDLVHLFDEVHYVINEETTSHSINAQIHQDEKANIALVLDKIFKESKKKYFIVINNLYISNEFTQEFQNMIGNLQDDRYFMITPKLLHKNKIVYNQISIQNHFQKYPNLPQYINTDRSKVELGYYFSLISPSNQIGINSRLFAINRSAYLEENYNTGDFPNDLFNVDLALRFHKKGKFAIQANNIELNVNPNIKGEKEVLDFDIREIKNFKVNYRGVKDPFYNKNLSIDFPYFIKPSRSIDRNSLDNKFLVCFTHNFNFEGAPKQLLSILIGLKEVYNNLKLLVVSPEDGPLKEEFIEAGIDTIVLPDHTKIDHYEEACNQVRNLLSDTDGRRADLVVANTLINFHCFEICEELEIPSIWFIHESAKPEHFFNFLDTELKLKALDAFNKVDAGIFVAKSTRNLFQPLNVNGAFFVINNALDKNFKIHEAESKNTLRKELGFKEDDFIYLNLGTICQRKGQNDFVRAGIKLLQSIGNEKDKIKFVMVGGRGDDYQIGMEAMIEESGFSSNFVVIGETKKVADYYNTADLFVCTSYNESYPRVIIEAIHYHLPIISTNTFGIKEQIIDGFNGYLYKAGDVEQLYSMMHSVFEDQTTLDTLREGAKESKELFINYDEMIEEYKEIFENYAI